MSELSNIIQRRRTNTLVGVLLGSQNDKDRIPPRYLTILETLPLIHHLRRDYWYKNLEEGGFTWDTVKKHHIEIIGKGRKRRRIPLHDTLRTILNSRRKERVPFPYTYSAVAQSLSHRLFHRAGIPDANLHTLRKTAGARLIQKGVDIYRVSKFLGHSSVKVTEKHYVDLLEVDYKDMSALLEDTVAGTSKISEPQASRWGKVA